MAYIDLPGDMLRKSADLASNESVVMIPRHCKRFSRTLADMKKSKSKKKCEHIKENRRNMLFTKSSRWNIVLIQPVVVVN